MKEKNDEDFKKETACLFYHFKQNKKETPIMAQIKLQKKEMKDYINNIDAYYIKRTLTEDEKVEKTYKNTYDSYRHFLIKDMNSNIKKHKINENMHKNQKKKFQLYSKINFGSFINNNSYPEEIRKKYEKLNEKISKSNNFSFVKDPKTISYKKLPFDLYLSKEDSQKIKNLISFRLTTIKSKIDNDKNESLTRFSYDNGSFDNNISSIMNNCNETKNKYIYYINKNKLNNKNIFKNKEQISEQHNLDKAKDLLGEEKNNESIRKKCYLIKYLSNLKNLNTKTNKKTNLKHQNSYNKTEHNIFHPNKKSFLLYELDKNIKSILRTKVGKNLIKSFSKDYKQKSAKKIKKIDKLMNNFNFEVSVIKDLKTNSERKNKNKTNFPAQIYMDIKNRSRFLSVVEKLKNIKREAPMMILSDLYENYFQKSKEIIKTDSIRKKINNIYKSSEKGYLIRRKINKTNDVINKIISKNKIEGIKLKNKYKLFDMIIEKINEENKCNL